MIPPTLATAGSVFLSILGIGLLIFIHELGHYVACLLTKTRVETFSIGFGTRLFGWERMPGEPRRFTVGRRRLDPAAKAMDFRVALVPLGGYVKMAGENPGEGKGATDEFPSKSMMARVFIISAGVLMNALAAWFFYTVAFVGEIKQEPAIAGEVRPGGPAWDSGMMDGDRILTLGGSRTRSFLDLKMETVFLSPGEATKAEVERGDEKVALTVVPRYDDDIGAVLLRIERPYTLEVRGKEATFTIGSTERVHVAGIPVRGALAAVKLIQDALSRPESLSVEVETGDGKRHTLQWVPADADPEAKPVYRVGIEPLAPPVVKRVRGAAKDAFLAEDRIVAALTEAGRIEIPNLGALDVLPWRAPVSHLVVRRVADEVEVPIDGATPAKVYAALADLHVERPETTRARQIELGTLVPGKAGIRLRYPSVPSAAAGLTAGDAIVGVAAREVSAWSDVTEAIGKVESGEPIELRVKGDDGAERTLVVVPVQLERYAGPDLDLKLYVEPFPTEGVFDAAGAAFGRTVMDVRNIFRLIGAFFTGRLSFHKNVGGPVTIVTVSASAADRDPMSFFAFLAYISITLAVLNILPIPILDGGHLLFILIERVKGSPLKEETMGKLQLVGLVLLLLLMVFAFKNDILLLMR